MDRGYVVDRKEHPKDTAGIWSLLTFSYIHPIIRRGNKRDLTEDDIPKVWSKFKSTELGDRMEQAWENQKVKKGQKKSVFRLLVDCFWRQYLLLGIFQLVVKVTYAILTPRAVATLVNYFKEGQTEISKNEAWFNGAIVIFTNAGYLFYEHHYVLLKTEFGMQIIISLSSLVYRKALRLSPAKLAEISIGKINTALVKDVVQIEEATYYLNDLWVEIVQSIVVLYLLYSMVGISGSAGLGTVFIVIIAQLYIALVVFKKRKAANNKSDERLQLTQEIITAIRVIKMYAWEKFFAKKIIGARKQEIRKIRTLTVLKFLAMFLGNLCYKLSYLFIIIVYLWTGHNLSAEMVYFTATCYQRLRRAIAFIIPICCGSIAEFIACLKRIETILVAEEIDPNEQNTPESVIMPKVDFVSVDVGVNKTPILKDVSMKLKPGLNVLIGPVGCGKSTLIKAILKEYILLSGKMNIEGTLSYAPQNPWVFPSSIKQNIVFGQAFDEVKYKRVLEACALKFDLDGLAEGDETILSDCSVNLSKGQQARVNIARALYKDSDIYLFDDSLSSLDSHVKQYIFENSIQEYLKDKLVILATHDTKFVSKADNVVIMLDGTVTYSGKPMDIPQKLTQSLESLDKDLCESDEENDDESKETEEDKPCNEKTELIAKMCSSTKANVYHESLATGGIGWENYKKYFMFGGGFVIFFIVFGVYVVVEFCSGYSDKLMTHWVLLEEKIALNQKRSMMTSNTNTTSNFASTTTDYILENISSISYDYESTSSYFTTETSSEDLSTSFTMSTIFTNDTSSNITSPIEYLLYERIFYQNWYCFLVIAACVLSFVANVLFFIFSLKVSKNLHKSMITNVLGSHISFFDVNMSGNIMNRFSKDLFNIDEWIPYIINEAMKMLTMMTSTGLLIASINLPFTIMTIALVVIFFLASRYCIKPARTLRRLDMATRSPLLGHLNASLEGLTTIRAYGTQSVLATEFDKHLDHYIAAHHSFEILMRCLSFSLHMLSAVYVTTIILKFLGQEGASSSNVGLAITQSFVLSNFLDWGVRQWVMLESIMTNFQRSVEYTDVKQELQTGQCLSNWPSRGCIKYQNVSLTYRENNETVLKNLNFTIEPNEKIGIVGRTGAGKSSIIVTLFRLYDCDGDIVIDDVSIKTLSLDYLRNNISIIPQDPIIFSGSVRSNVDPLRKFSDNDIWQALSAVNLKAFITDLDEDIHDTGLTYSVGQRQLLCLARAIVRKTKIIILDEATANMDEETDLFIHNKIEQLFENCTTITVAHRLNSVMRCDRVIVMDRGEIIEFESPNALLENKDSIFYKMVHHHDDQ
ncbi:ATP-binding cassette sub-family C member 4-like [Coccinella septempunctata]|uniref:ATP-binding cassette sub-family C member 4-like n=1 Tax=Coccinella septempunctata TaxID=41139 RepID=UPI001D099E7A|nr:ATP-binding cassette sub-family C member 4-like [Coccinella septempunctata]